MYYLQYIIPFNFDYSDGSDTVRRPISVRPTPILRCPSPMLKSQTCPSPSDVRLVVRQTVRLKINAREIDSVATYKAIEA